MHARQGWPVGSSTHVQVRSDGQKPSLEQPGAQKGAPAEATQAACRVPQLAFVAQGSQATGACSVTPPVPNVGTTAGAPASLATGVDSTTPPHAASERTANPITTRIDAAKRSEEAGAGPATRVASRVP